MQKTLPDSSPLIANNIVCSACGDVIQPEVVSGRRGVDCIRYKHTNKEKGCNYVVESKSFLMAEMKPLRDDGSEVKL